MVASFAPSGEGATQTFVLDNNGSDQIAVQLEAFRRGISVEGQESRVPTDEFSIYPPQLALKPGEKRNVRVSWAGSRQTDHELAYRLVVSQLPVNLKKPSERHQAGANITFLMQYVASLYVTPSGVIPKVEVKSFKVLPDGKGELVLANLGGAHRVLQPMHLQFKLPGGKTLDAPPADLQQLQGENLLAQSERKFAIALPKAVLKAEKTKPASVGVSLRLK